MTRPRMDSTAAPPFAALLRRYRLAAGLSQEELAARAHLSARAISTLERGVRRAPYRDTVSLLAAALGLTTAERAALAASVSRGRRPAAAPAAQPAPSPTNLPTPATSFVGRAQEQIVVLRLLESVRLLTLTGTGGVGKTRLATHVAATRTTATAYPDGVHLVELAPLTDPTLVPQTVAQTLGVREQPGRPLLDALTETLCEKSTLLLLDNCEHLLAAVATFAETLLHACPGVRILATSREALGAIGETVWWVPSLSVPSSEFPVPGGAPMNSDLDRVDAVRLFVERATAAQPAFALTDATAPAVATICRRLDGIPLALELAAARTRILTPEQIAARLDERFRLLTGGNSAVPRHETLRAALDWSYKLLTDPEQHLLARLAVFAGSCDLAAADAVCTDKEQVPPPRPVPWSLFPGPSDSLFDLLTSLVEKSLITVEYRGETARYRLPETVRQYAAEHLDASGDADAIVRRHRDWALALAEHASPLLNGPEQATWLERLETEHDNMRAVLQWAATSGEAGHGLALAAALNRFWLVRGYLTECRTWLARLLTRADAAPPTLRAQALHITARFAMRQGDYAAAGAGADAALALYQDLNDDQGVAQSLIALGQIAYFRGDFATAAGYAEEGLAIARRIDDRPLIYLALSDLANAVQFQGELDAALACYQEAVAICRGLGDLTNVSVILGNFALLTIRREDYAAARPLVEEALALQHRLGGRMFVPRMLSWLATIDQEEGDSAAARHHLEQALDIARETGDADAVAGTEENFADLHRQGGDLAAAAVHAAEALRLAATLDDGKRHVTALFTAAKIAADLRRFQRAARLFGAAQALQATIGFVPFPNVAREVDEYVATLRDSLGQPAFSELWFDGASMTAQRALAYAITDTDRHLNDER